VSDTLTGRYHPGMNVRFFGAWLLDSFESQLADGTVARPWGDDPLGIIYWEPSGYFAVQLGPGTPDRKGDYISFFGTAEAPNGESGTIVLHVVGSSDPDRVNGSQTRDFLFLESRLLRMRPPVGSNASQSTFMWRRVATTSAAGGL
jgi:Lipocalin-like domain